MQVQFHWQQIGTQDSYHANGREHLRNRGRWHRLKDMCFRVVRTSYLKKRKSSTESWIENVNEQRGTNAVLMSGLKRRDKIWYSDI